MNNLKKISSNLFGQEIKENDLKEGLDKFFGTNLSDLKNKGIFGGLNETDYENKKTMMFKEIREKAK